MVDGARFASHEYSFEELIAECGSAFLCAEGGISPSTIENSAAYLGSWIKKLRSEPRWIVEAASLASKAADLVLGRGLKAREETSENEAA